MFDKNKPLEVLATAIAIGFLTTTGTVAAPTVKLTNQQFLESTTEILAQKPEAKDYLQQGIELYQKGDTEGAETAFREAIAIDPDFAHAHSNLGTIFANQNQMTAAIQEFEEAVRLQPDMAFFHYQLGIALFMENRSQEALSSLEQAKDLFADQGKTQQAGQMERAIAEIEARK